MNAVYLISITDSLLSSSTSRQLSICTAMAIFDITLKNTYS